MQPETFPKPPDRRPLRRGPWLAITRLGMALSFLPFASGCQQKAAPTEPATEKAADAGGDKEKKPDEEAAVPEVEVATARAGVVEKTVPLTGVLRAYRDRKASIGVPIAGVLDSLPVRLGQSVRQGEVIAHLSTRPLLGQIAQAKAGIAQNTLQIQQAQTNATQQQGQTQSAVRQAEAAVAGAKATLAAAEATLTGNQAAVANAQQSATRTQALFGEGLVAKKDVEAADLAVRSAEAQAAAQRQAVSAQREAVRGQEQALAAARTAGLQDAVKRTDVQIARQQLENARGTLETTQAQLALYTLRAPITGVITLVSTAVGETVDPATKILTITDLRKLQLEIAVPTTSVSLVHPGQTVHFTVDSVPGHTFTSTIRAYGTQVDATNATVVALVDVENPGNVLKEEMFAKVRVVTERHRAGVLIPSVAVLYEAAADGGRAASVVVVGADGKTQKKSVTVGITDNDSVEVLSGLTAGARVATTGAYGLPDGTKVKLADAKGVE